MDSEDIEEKKSGRFAQAFCVLSIAAVSGAIVHNAVFAQESRVFSESRISISADSTRLDKLFSVLNVNNQAYEPGHTRVSVEPASTELSDPPTQHPAADELVLKAQRQLADLGTYSGINDGILGEDTRVAIMRYQKDKGLAVTGKPDAQFLEHLQYMHHIHQASTVTGGTSKLTDSKSVERAQRQLQLLGYDPGPIDGKLGTKTTDAIRHFQVDMQLTADGELSSQLLNQLAPARTSQVE